MNTLHSHLVCCFCDNELSLDSRVCGVCREYKGIMTVDYFEAYLNTTFDCDCLSDLDDKVSA